MARTKHSPRLSTGTTIAHNNAPLTSDRPEHWMEHCDEFVRACAHESPQQIQERLDAGGIYLDYVNGFHETAWDAACRNPEYSTPVVEKLLLQQRQPAVSLSFLPLVQACRYRRSNLVQKFLEMGADINESSKVCSCAPDGTPSTFWRHRACWNHGYTYPLHAALTGPLDRPFDAQGVEETIRVLLEYSPSLNGTSRTGIDFDEMYQDSLCLACELHSLNVVQMLLDAGANVNSNSMYGNALMFAMCRVGPESTEMMHLLLQHEKMEPETKGKALVNALYGYNAAIDGNLPVINLESAKLLMTSGGVDVNFFHDETYPILEACRHFHVAMATLLLDHGADLHVTGRFGMGVWETIVEYFSETCNDVNTWCELLQVLVQKGANVNAIDTRGRTLLDMACSSPVFTIRQVEVILDHGAELSAASLVAAVKAGKRDVVSTLLKRGMDPNQFYTGNATVSNPPPEPITPLQVAKKSGNTEIIELMRSYGTKTEAGTR